MKHYSTYYTNLRDSGAGVSRAVALQHGDSTKHPRTDIRAEDSDADAIVQDAVAEPQATPHPADSATAAVRECVYCPAPALAGGMYCWSCFRIVKL